MAEVVDQTQPAGKPDGQFQGRDGAEIPDKASGDPPFFKRTGGRLVLAVVIIGILVVAVRYYIYTTVHESTDDAFIDGHIIALSPKVAGQVVDVYVTDNQLVKKGEVLLRIDPRDFEVRLAQARAALQAAIARQKAARINVHLASVQQAQAAIDLNRAGVSTSHSQVAAAQSRLDQARADLTAARANADRAQADARRYQKLYAERTIPRQQLDTALATAVSTAAQVRDSQAVVRAQQEALHQTEFQVREAEARMQDAVGRVTSAQTGPYQVAASQAQVESGGADIAQARANVRQAELQFEYTRITAPTNGRITRKTIEEGSYVQVGQEIMALVRPEVWVTANFKETQLNHMHPGQAVQIWVDAYRGQIFKGHVDSIQAGSGARFSLLPPENASGNYVKVVQRVPVKIDFDEPPQSLPLLTPGLSVIPVVETK